MKPALLIALPSGLTIGGVQVWAARLVNELAARGRSAGLILHPGNGAALDIPIDPRVRVVQAPKRLDGCNGDLSPFLASYRAAVDALAASGQAVVCVPCHVGDCTGVFAALTRERGDVRVAGWCHLDSPYERRVLEFYRPVLGHVAAVSDHLAAELTQRLHGVQVWNISCGVSVGGGRGRYNTARPRIIYLGRLNRDVKRVMALFTMCDELRRLGVMHELTIVGDGPASGEVARAAAGRDHITLLPAASPGEVASLFDEHDIFVLPSRVEGLSIAMLEAAARGCVPVVARTESGSGQVIDGSNGVVVDVAAEADEAPVGVAIAHAITRVLRQLPAMSTAAIRTVEDRYSIARHVDHAEAMIDAAAAQPPRRWPTDRNPSFTAMDAAWGSGAVPPGGADCVRALFRVLKGRSVVVHGVGQHSIELAGVLAEHRGQIAAFADDDPQRQGEMLLGLPVIAPAEARAHGADAVIISSWINMDDIWARRGVYEAQGLEVRRIYATRGTRVGCIDGSGNGSRDCQSRVAADLEMLMPEKTPS